MVVVVAAVVVLVVDDVDVCRSKTLSYYNSRLR